MSTTLKSPPTEKLEHKELASPDEAQLIWDEYKYRHDLIWRHIIRSTVALVALLTVRYTQEFGDNLSLSFVAWVLAIGYIAFTYFIVRRELQLLGSIRDLHRERQRAYFGLDFMQPQNWWDFSRRVMAYLIVLLILVALAGPFSLCDEHLKISFAC